MNHLEFNKPHIQQKLRNSWSIENYQATVGREVADAIFWDIDRIEWYFKTLQEIIDQPWDREKDWKEVDWIFYEATCAFSHWWTPGKWNKYWALVYKLHILLHKAEVRLGRTPIINFIDTADMD